MINCIVRTPQFKSDGSNDFTEQSGKFNPFSGWFYPDGEYVKGRIKSHKIKFSSVDQFFKYQIWV